MTRQKIICGDNNEVLKDFADNSIDSCVTDPPYGLKFMGKKWDYEVPKVELWKEVYRVLKPGAHILVACGTRTQHRMAVNIEDAGFEIRDVISWIYGSGFPKSLDISKAIDKQAGAEREKIKRVRSDGKLTGQDTGTFMSGVPTVDMQYSDDPITDESKQWNGWGTALKPAQELWTLARKPLSEDTVAENVLKHGTGGINIDGTRIGDRGKEQFTGAKNGTINAYGDYFYKKSEIPLPSGRFPANIILDEFMASELDKQSGITTSSGESGEKSMGALGKNGKYGNYALNVLADNAGGLGDTGGASRFFYCAKADGYERNNGLGKFEPKKMDLNRKEGNVGGDNPRNRGVHERKNFHPTVKPIDLMRYLVRLITPKGATILDPFNGSGTTGIAAKLEFMNYIGIEKEEDYCKISEARIAATHAQTDLFNI